MTAPAKLTSTFPPPTKRWRKWFRSRLRVHCPAGHHIPNDYRIRGHGEKRCDHWIPGDRRECGRWVYLQMMPGGGATAIEVSLDDLKAMENMETQTEIFDYLDIGPSD